MKTVMTLYSFLECMPKTPITHDTNSILERIVTCMKMQMQMPFQTVPTLEMFNSNEKRHANTLAIAKVNSAKTK